MRQLKGREYQQNKPLSCAHLVKEQVLNVSFFAPRIMTSWGLLELPREATNLYEEDG